MSGKTGNGSIVDLESLKALVAPQNNKIVVDRVAKEGSVRLLPGAKRKRGSSLRQVCASLMANIGTINTGMAFGFPAVAIPQLQEENNGFITIDKYQSSWIASLSAVGTPIGCLLSGYLMDLIGRKRALIITQFPMLAGWLLIGSATSLPMIYAGRLLVGLGSGMVGAPARVYTGEATQPHLRGMLAAIGSVGVSLGVLIEYALGACLLPWKTIAIVSSVVPALALIGALLIPETPSFLMSSGKVESSKKALSKLRGPTCDIDFEAGELQRFAEKNNIHKPTVKETLKGLMQRSTYVPFFILALYFLIYQFSGVNPITFYAVNIFQESGAKMDKHLATVLTGVVRLIFTVVSAGLLRRCGRRPLTFVSSIGCGLTLLVLGTYMYFNSQWIEQGVEPKYTWIPVTALLLFTIASVMGYLVVPWVMISEVYPTQIRGVAGGLTTFSAHFCIFLVVKTYPILQDFASNYGAFWFYGAVSMLGTVFFYVYLPETKGRTLQEIEEYFTGQRDTLKAPKKSKNIPPVIAAPKGNALP
ncbi:Sugar (and other) transporter [Nesidiocoris tenuis]|uniref:Sugar (And other) transporter n=1 Tax=Nesidiocoris tenuis TaxID=355587 RepID=A0ABN7AHT0_9HEMI|nr:Sugar (and other) transporter [Nesidiocoris tenuis]